MVHTGRRGRVNFELGVIGMGLQWREQLSVGNDLIDADHQRLIEIINLADHSLRTVNRAELVTALDQLFKYSQVHFGLEEKIAAAVGYPNVSQIHASHESLLEKLTQLTQQIGAKWDATAAEHFGAFLREWLINHVIKEDMLLKPYLKTFSPRFDPRV
jgi:hemerythrin